MAQCDKTLEGTRNSPRGGTFRIGRSRPFLHMALGYWCPQDGRPRTESGHRLGRAKCTSSLESCYEEIPAPLLPSPGTCSQAHLTLPLASMPGATFRPALGPSWDGISQHTLNQCGARSIYSLGLGPRKEEEGRESIRPRSG